MIPGERVRPARQAARLVAFLALSILLPACGKEKKTETPAPVVVPIGGADGKIFDTEFERGKYFLLDDPDTLVTISLRGQRIDPQDVALFAARGNLGVGAREGAAGEPAIATLDGVTRQGRQFLGQFEKLRQIDDYYFSSLSDTNPPFLVLRNPLPAEYTLAVSYLVRDPQRNIVRGVGNYFTRVTSDTLELKVIRPALADQNEWLTAGDWAPTRRLELKNVYDLGVREIDGDSFKLELHRIDGGDPPGPGGASCLEALGLDLVNNDTGLAREGTRYPGVAHGPDGKVDSEYLDRESGLLLLPDLRPFDPSCIDLNGAEGCGAPASPVGDRGPGRRWPRQWALGWRRVVNAGAPDIEPLYGYRYERAGADSAVAETNPAIYDRREPVDSFRKYYLSGYFTRPR